MAKIMIAEDERDIRELIVITLRTVGGHEVVAVPNGAELVELAPLEKPDMILTDVRMPRMTGYEACLALKENPATRDIPVVMLSAKGQEEEVTAGIDSGALDYILKPFAPDQLLVRVAELLEKAAKLKEEAKASDKAETGDKAKADDKAKPDDKAKLDDKDTSKKE